MKRKKTNAMRMLERADVEFEVNYYEVEDAHQDGETIAHSLEKIQNMSLRPSY